MKSHNMAPLCIYFFNIEHDVNVSLVTLNPEMNSLIGISLPRHFNLLSHGRDESIFLLKNWTELKMILLFLNNTRRPDVAIRRNRSWMLQSEETDQWFLIQVICLLQILGRLWSVDKLPNIYLIYIKLSSQWVFFTIVFISSPC